MTTAEIILALLIAFGAGLVVGLYALLFIVRSVVVSVEKTVSAVQERDQ